MFHCMVRYSQSPCALWFLVSLVAARTWPRVRNGDSSSATASRLDCARLPVLKNRQTRIEPKSPFRRDIAQDETWTRVYALRTTLRSRIQSRSRGFKKGPRRTVNYYRTASAPLNFFSAHRFLFCRGRVGRCPTLFQFCACSWFSQCYLILWLFYQRTPIFTRLSPVLAMYKLLLIAPSFVPSYSPR